MGKLMRQYFLRRQKKRFQMDEKVRAVGVCLGAGQAFSRMLVEFLPWLATQMFLPKKTDSNTPGDCPHKYPN